MRPILTHFDFFKVRWRGPKFNALWKKFSKCNFPKCVVTVARCNKGFLCYMATSVLQWKCLIFKNSCLVLLSKNQTNSLHVFCIINNVEEEALELCVSIVLLKRSKVGEWVSSVDKRRRLNIMYNFDDINQYTAHWCACWYSIWNLLTRSQCSVCDTQVTDKARGPLIFVWMSEYKERQLWIYLIRKALANIYDFREVPMYLIENGSKQNFQSKFGIFTAISSGFEQTNFTGKSISTN